MTIHTYEAELWLPAPIADVFTFFSDAHNLERITPAWLHFSIQTPSPIRLRAGARIDYRLRIHGFPVRWQTEITVWDPPLRFVDEQRRGPYRQWIHTHTFTEEDGGTQCKDRVEYCVPGGRLIHALFVRRDVERIFAYRQKTLQSIFCRDRTS